MSSDNHSWHGVKQRQATEQAIQTKIKALLESRGWFVVKVPGVEYGEGGHSDLFAVHDGNAYSIEVKRPGEYPEHRQIVRMTEMWNAGGVAIWADNPFDVRAIIDTSYVDARKISNAQIARLREMRGMPTLDALSKS